MTDLRDVLTQVRTRIKNARGAVESNQVADKDVHGTLTRTLETIDEALTAGVQAVGSHQPRIATQFRYTNYKDEHEIRNVYPLGIWYGSTAWHPEKQWFLHAFDIDRDSHRDFALKDIGTPPPESQRRGWKHVYLPPHLG